MAGPPAPPAVVPPGWSVPPRTFWISAAGIVIAVASVYAVVALVHSAEGSGACFRQNGSDLAAAGQPRWTTAHQPEHKKLAIALDDYVDAPRSDGTTVTVKAT